MREALNRRLLLGMIELEAHYALYPPGAAYARHRDRFRDDDARVLSTVLYLNADWREEDGGALRLYLGGDAKNPHLDIYPNAGTLVLFLSAEFDHEVLPATRERLSVAGWFRRSPTIGAIVIASGCRSTRYRYSGCRAFFAIARTPIRRRNRYTAAAISAPASRMSSFTLPPGAGTIGAAGARTSIVPYMPLPGEPCGSQK